MLECTKCSRYLDIECFTTKSGRITQYCRECKAHYQREWIRRNRTKVNQRKKELYHSNIEKERERVRKSANRFRENNPESKQNSSAKYREANRDVLRKKGREYYQRTYEKRKAYQEQRKLDHPEKHAAKVQIQIATRYGRLVRPNECSVCGAVADRIEGHHEDYSKPLEVVWCCVQCHRRLDSLRREKEVKNEQNQRDYRVT